MFNFRHFTGGTAGPPPQKTGVFCYGVVFALRNSGQTERKHNDAQNRSNAEFRH